MEGPGGGSRGWAGFRRHSVRLGAYPLRSRHCLGGNQDATNRRLLRARGCFNPAVPANAGHPAFGCAAEPITIGFAEALTGSLAVVGKSGLLGGSVKLVYYGNQSNPANIPGIYTKLIDVDHVNLIVSPYATNMAAPAVPIAMAHGKLFISVSASQ